MNSLRILLRRSAPPAAAQRNGLIRHTARLIVAVCLIAVPLQAFNSVSDSLSPVNNLPRFALVIGNSRYQEAPLRNPSNDANAIAEQLRRMGFAVTLKLDAGRREMVETIQSFGNSLAKQKGVGLFYFAGHGAQLAWRNYLIPVDAVIEQVSDMQSRAVDVGTLLEGLSKAGNPMNVVILDACRDNPFGKAKVEQKGLSQIDAPPGTLLAYATSPGNVAADGSGTNGLYTEYLLKEMQAREAKIEDIFKRVRLNVRRESQGRQIPWESTSLEEDFYFLPPAQIRKLTPEEIEKQFEEELGVWEKIKASKDPAPLEDYIRKYPSGKFSELAQFRLDRLFSDRQAKLAEESRIAEEKRLAEERRLAEEKRIATEKRLAEERRVAEEKRIADEKRLAKLTEEKRIAEENRLAQERKLAEERRIAEEKRLFAERRLADEKRLAEEKRLADERKIAQLEEEKRAKLQTQVASSARAQPASIAPNPFSRGTAAADGNYRIGDSYSYRTIDTLTKLETRQYTNRVTGITDTEVVFNGGRRITDLLGNALNAPNGNQILGQQIYVSEYRVGKKWTTRYRFTRPDGQHRDVEIDFRVVARENITVPAGTFDAFKVEGRGFNMDMGTALNWTYWIAPDKVRQPIVFEAIERSRGGRYRTTNRNELVSYRQSD